MIGGTPIGSTEGGYLMQKVHLRVADRLKIMLTD